MLTGHGRNTQESDARKAKACNEKHLRKRRPEKAEFEEGTQT